MHKFSLNGDKQCVYEEQWENRGGEKEQVKAEMYFIYIFYACVCLGDGKF